MLDVRLKHRFDGLHLDIAFTLSDGVTALFGPSGSGKSSTLNAIAGLFRPQEASIHHAGRTLQEGRQFVKAHRRQFGVVFQDARLFPHMSVAQNLDYGTRFARSAPVVSRDDLLALLDLIPLLDRAPATLSGGEAQRVAIGRALLSAPRLLLMDEPLASLDAPRKAEILPYLERLKHEARLPMLYVSHDMDEVARLADTLILLKDGRAVAQGPIFDVLSNPAALPLLGVREAGAILSAEILSHSSDGLSKLRLAAGDIELPGVSAPEGARIRLRILASDVILSLHPPEGLSAMNVLPVTIKSIREGVGPGAAIALDAAGDTLLSRVTARTVARLGLQQGQPCYAILKAMSVAPAAIGGNAGAPS